MHLEGSCHCGAVKFSVEANAPVPYMRCYCSICRKTAGGPGYAINLGARAATLQVDGEDKITTFRARKDGKQSAMERKFCSICGTALWGWSPEWPELLHPFASAIDTDLPEAPNHTHIMLGSRASWVPLDTTPGDELFDEYPDQSLADWHKSHGFAEDD